MVTGVITPFDPWKSKLCTCPEKYSFNPYTGCAHNCIYCYATYIPRFDQVRTKKDLFRKLERDLNRLPDNAVISMSNSSDPYPPVEKKLQITRRCLEIFKEYDIGILLVTKSDIFTRDLDILSEMNAAVSVTITGCDKAEPHAPPTDQRIQAFKKLKDWNIPAILRFDPIIPGINQSKVWIIEKCEPDHVVTSTLKLRRDSLKKIAKVYPDLANWLVDMYLTKGERKGRYYYLPKNYRERLLRMVEKFCADIGVKCAFCREGIPFKSRSCDGSHLLRV
jgi:DNA repair photolyase